MNNQEGYFRISKNGHIHTLSDRIPFNWKELVIWTSTSFLLLIFFGGFLAGILISILTLIGYTLFRFASWIYYSEIEIDEKSGKLVRLKKILNKTQKVDLITDKFDPSRFEFTELNRSGNTKFLMIYRTHKNHELLIFKNEVDKEFVKKYLMEKITV